MHLCEVRPLVQVLVSPPSASHAIGAGRWRKVAALCTRNKRTVRKELHVLGSRQPMIPNSPLDVSTSRFRVTTLRFSLQRQRRGVPPVQWPPHSDTMTTLEHLAAQRQHNHRQSHDVGVVAQCAHRVRTVATISGQTPVNHPKMHQPKQPEPQKILIARTRPVFLRFVLMVANKSQRLLGSSCSFLGAS